MTTVKQGNSTKSGRITKWSKTLRGAVIGLLCVGAGMGTSAALAGTAQAATIASGTPVMAAPYTWAYWYGGPLWNSYASLHCWIDTNSWSYGTNRWFQISTTIYNPRTGRFQGQLGYASANRISGQHWTPRCW